MKIHIVSDGTPMGTHVTGDGGVPIENITRAELVIDAREGVSAILFVHRITVNANNVESEVVNNV